MIIKQPPVPDFGGMIIEEFNRLCRPFAFVFAQITSTILEVLQVPQTLIHHEHLFRRHRTSVLTCADTLPEKETNAGWKIITSATPEKENAK